MAAEIHSKSERLLGTDANKSGRVRRVQSADRTKVWVGRDLQRLLSAAHLPSTRTSFTTSGCSKPLPTWP